MLDIDEQPTWNHDSLEKGNEYSETYSNPGFLPKATFWAAGQTEPGHPAQKGKYGSSPGRAEGTQCAQDSGKKEVEIVQRFPETQRTH